MGYGADFFARDFEGEEEIVLLALRAQVFDCVGVAFADLGLRVRNALPGRQVVAVRAGGADIGGALVDAAISDRPCDTKFLSVIVVIAVVAVVADVDRIGF